MPNSFRHRRVAWTYLMHAWFKREGMDYRHTKNVGGEKLVMKTPSGAQYALERRLPIAPQFVTFSPD